MVSPCCRPGMTSKKIYQLSVKGRPMLVTGIGSMSVFSEVTCN